LLKPLSNGELNMSLEQALAANTAAIEKLVAVLSGPTIDVGETAPKTKRTKKEAAPEAPAGEPVEEATAPSPEAGATDAPAAEDAAAPTEPPTYADAAAAVTRVVKELGTPRAKDLLKGFGAGNLKEVDPGRYAEVIEAAYVLLDEIPF
jgi:hypothetical protein